EARFRPVLPLVCRAVGGCEMAVSCEKAPKSRRQTRALLLRQWMQVAHQALQPLFHNMGVDLGSRDIRVAKQRLYDAQVGAVVQEMAGKCVAQHVRADQPWSQS